MKTANVCVVLVRVLWEHSAAWMAELFADAELVTISIRSCDNPSISVPTSCRFPGICPWCCLLPHRRLRLRSQWPALHRRLALGEMVPQTWLDGVLARARTRNEVSERGAVGLWVLGDVMSAKEETTTMAELYRVEERHHRSRFITLIH